jgi:6-pyruvoyltetrahydropterin/6-carboxytetrahydropterin synthase
MTVRITRSYTFSAAHVLARPDWSDARNRDVYGKCANPAGHGHNYELEVTLRGEPDPDAGRLVSLEQMDAVVKRLVLEALDHRFLNRELPQFATEVPTAENIARFCWQALKGEFSPAVLDRIRLVETRNNSVEYSEEGMQS